LQSYRQDQSPQRKERGGGAQMSEADQRSRRCDDQSRLLEPNECNEKSNPGSDRILERAGKSPRRSSPERETRRARGTERPRRILRPTPRANRPRSPSPPRLQTATKKKFSPMPLARATG